MTSQFRVKNSTEGTKAQQPIQVQLMRQKRAKLRLIDETMKSWSDKRNRVGKETYKQLTDQAINITALKASFAKESHKRF